MQYLHESPLLEQFDSHRIAVLRIICMTPPNILGDVAAFLRDVPLIWSKKNARRIEDALRGLQNQRP